MLSASPTSYAHFAGVAETSRSTSRFRLAKAVILLWWLLHLGALFYTGADPNASLQATEDGSWLNRIQIVLFGVIGLSAIVPALSVLRRSRCTWPYWFLAYLGWSACTLLWSASPMLGIRRFAATVLISAGAIGIGAGYYGQTTSAPYHLLKHLRRAGMIALLFCVPLFVNELSVQKLLDPSWMPSFRPFGAEIGFAAAYALIVSMPLRRLMMSSTELGTTYKLSTAALLVLLVLLKSRALIVFTLLIFAAAYIKTTRKTQLFVGISFLVLALGILVGFVATTSDVDVGGQLFTFIARGDNMRTLSLINGRVPLWVYVWNDALLHPWLGVGFGSYWTATRLAEVWQSVQWQAPCAHNGFLDEMAQTGLVGVGLFLAFCIAAARDLKRIALKSLKLPATLVLWWLALFLLINTIDSILQFYFKVPFFFTLAAISSCCAASAQRQVKKAA